MRFYLIQEHSYYSYYVLLVFKLMTLKRAELKCVIILYISMVTGIKQPSRRKSIAEVL